MISMTASSRSLLSHGRNGCRSCSRSLLGSTSTVIADPSGGGTCVGGWVGRVCLPHTNAHTLQIAHLVGVLSRIKSLHRVIRVCYHDNSSAPPTQSCLTLDGSSSPYGGLSLNRSPLAPTSSSVKGLKSRDPARARAVTTCSVRGREGGWGGVERRVGGGGRVGREDVEEVGGRQGVEEWAGGYRGGRWCLRAHLWGGHKGVCAGVAIVPPSEVAVVGGHNGVLLSLLHVLPPPLPNAGPTGVGQHSAPQGRQGLVLPRREEASG